MAKVLKIIFQSSSALNILLVLSRDDCTLPQLNVTILKGLLDALMAHLKTVLKALFPEKTAKIGQKRKLEKVKEETNINNERAYQINYKQVRKQTLIEIEILSPFFKKIFKSKKLNQ